MAVRVKNVSSQKINERTKSVIKGEGLPPSSIQLSKNQWLPNAFVLSQLPEPGYNFKALSCTPSNLSLQFLHLNIEIFFPHAYHQR